MNQIIDALIEMSFILSQINGPTAAITIVQIVLI